MKYNRKTRTIISGILVGLASIYAVAIFFDVQMSELNGFMLATLLFFVTIVLLAAAAILLLKLGGALLRKLSGRIQDDRTHDNRSQNDKE